MIDKLKLLLAILVLIGGIAAFYWFGDLGLLYRVAMVVAGFVATLLIILTTEIGKSAWRFLKGADLERRKVVWPTRRDTFQGTLVVILMVILVGVYLWLLDSLSFWVIYDLLLGVS